MTGAVAGSAPPRHPARAADTAGAVAGSALNVSPREPQQARALALQGEQIAALPSAAGSDVLGPTWLHGGRRGVTLCSQGPAK